MRIENKTDLISVNEATPVLKSGFSTPKFMQSITLAAVVSVAMANDANALDCRELPGIQSSTYKQATCDRLSPNIDESHVVGFSTDGHLISYINGKYVYSETNMPVDENLLPDKELIAKWVREENTRRAKELRAEWLREENIQRVREENIQRAKEVRAEIFREENIRIAKEVREALLKSIELLGTFTDLSEEQELKYKQSKELLRKALEPLREPTDLSEEQELKYKQSKERLRKALEPLGASTDLSEEQELKYKQSKELLRKALENLAEEE